MMQKLVVPYLIAAVVVATGLFSVGASAAACRNDKAVLGFPTWFHGLNCDDTPDGGQTVNISGSVSKIWIIVLNVVQWLIIAAGYVALYFIIWSGFKYIMGQGEPDKIKSAKDTLANAIIGLIIVLAAVAIVQTIQAGITGTIT